MENRLITPTRDEKNFEIKRKEFNQNREIKSDLSSEYLSGLFKLLNIKNKDFHK